MQPYNLMSQSKLLFLSPTFDDLSHQTGDNELHVHAINPLSYPVSLQ